MADHINDIPLAQLLLYEDGELIFDGSDPDTYVLLEPGVTVAQLAELLAGRDQRAVPGSPAHERARRNPAARAALDHLAKEILP
jgi:hypothetical protein